MHTYAYAFFADWKNLSRPDSKHVLDIKTTSFSYDGGHFCTYSQCLAAAHATAICFISICACASLPLENNNVSKNSIHFGGERSHCRFMIAAQVQIACP